ncbi:MAG: DUF3108 domain-containing protein [bacterium]|jgi:hypothetical protein
MFPSAVLISLAWALLPGDGDPHPASIPVRAHAGNPALVAGSYCIKRGNQPEIWVPPGEELEFRVEIDLGPLGSASVGTVVMSSGVEPFLRGLPLPGETPMANGVQVAWVRSVARGGHLGYELNHSITTRFLPQEWPALLNFEVQTGSENRKRELKIGRREGAWTSSYRGNGHCKKCSRREHFVEALLPWQKAHHCKRCKRAEHRLWRQPSCRPVPAETVDVLGAVYLARTLVRSGLDEIDLTMLQKSDLWNMKLTRGRLARIDSHAGAFECREVQLSVSQPEGESGGSKQFSGLFGIKGAIKIWIHATTGVPVLIEGDVPVGEIIDLHARIKLVKYSGTPSGFSGL